MLFIDPFITLIKTRYPALSTESVSVNQSGWSNLVLIVGGKLVFRFPRSDNAKKTLLVEQRLLPVLGPALPVPIPQYVYTSSPTDEIAYVGYPLIKGDPLLPEKLRSFSKAQREAIARQLGAFLTALHTFPLDKAFSFSVDASDTKKTWQGVYERIKGTAYSYMEPSLIAWTDHVFTRFLSSAASFRFSPCLLHNDLKPAHILYSFRQRAISGIIDFGSMWAGDPAYDFVGLYAAYGEDFTAVVVQSYGAAIDPAFFRRIDEFYLKIMSFWKLLHGIETSDRAMIQSALEKLRAVARQERG